MEEERRGINDDRDIILEIIITVVSLTDNALEITQQIHRSSGIKRITKFLCII